MIQGDTLNKETYLKLAIKEAMSGVAKKEGAPFGACIVNNNQVIATAHDTVLKDNDATCHAEINVIRMASKLLNYYRLDTCEIYCTSEPCPMCLAAIHWTGIKTCYFIVDRSIAAFYGFDDQLLYDEFKKPITERNMNIIQSNELNENVRILFQKWQDTGLPVC